MHVLQKLIAYGALSIFSIRDYSKTYARSRYYDEAKPWNERCDVAFAGSNMPFTPEGVQILRKASVLIAPSMAAGAGGMRLWLENLN
ncbi:hypothetical protein D0Y65_044263 [Glycine soja]|uniref:Glutamate/phenylalanine/leucine/valine/L-tryptophan dehydrogenase C-terminal domain-containing protein n=1 Tax=Glycine soja TaxID=3848 RepID=A0A445GKY0_GLYSO|nr:hypothetical protein JHK87_045668 [Glycine soja]RZB61898.1 hypothetical protein D0Y65_044263 [Glycine soja]